jgi:hypothetical protein
MTKRYETVVDGQPWLVRSGAENYVACCDCGLVHKEIYEIAYGMEPQPILVRVWRDNRRTANERRRKGVTIGKRRK